MDERSKTGDVFSSANNIREKRLKQERSNELPKKQETETHVPRHNEAIEASHGYDQLEPEQ
jgi:hypothetical protein